MKSKTKIIIFSLLILMLSISAASAHENIIEDGNNTVNDIIGINHFDYGLDDDGLDDDSDDWDDDSDLDEDDDDWDDDEDLDDDYWDDDDCWDDDEDLDDDYWDDDDCWDDDEDLDDDYWDDDDCWDDDEDLDDDYWDDDWDGNYTNSSIKFYKLISYYRNETAIYKTTSSIGNMSYADLGSEEDCEDTWGNDSDDWNEDSQEESGLKDLQSFMTACSGASASFEAPDVLSENHGSVLKSINQGQNLLDDEKEGNVTGDKDYDTINFSSDDDLDVLGLLVSILLCILLLI